MRADVFTQTVRRAVSFPYLLFEPASSSGGGEGLHPLLLFLHGAGEKGNDGARLPNAVLPRLLLGAGLSSPPLFIACPQCPVDRAGWPIEDLAVFLDALLADLPVDPDRVFLSGISLGGRGAWEFAYDHAPRLAALAPLCGPSLPTLAPRLADLPIWVFHGADDAVVPVSGSDAMVEALQRAGASALRYSRLDGVGHNCGNVVYRDPALWHWLLEQRRRAV